MLKLLAEVSPIPLTPGPLAVYLTIFYALTKALDSAYNWYQNSKTQKQLERGISATSQDAFIGSLLNRVKMLEDREGDGDKEITQLRKELRIAEERINDLEDELRKLRRENSQLKGIA